MSSFGGSIKLTGEDEYRKALKNISQGLKEVSSELSLTTTQFENSDKKTKDLKQAQEQLTKVYESQKSKVDELKNAYNSFSQKVAEQSAKHKELVESYDKEKAELDKLGKTLGTTSKEYQDQKEKVDSLSQEVVKSTKAEEENANALSKMKTALNNAEKDLSNTSREMEDLGKKTKETGDGFTVFKGILANLGTQAINSAINGLKSLGGALINVGKQAITSYAEYEQLVGGVETLFKDSAGIVQEYANEAYKTAGISANEYMETVTGFSASLLQSLDGDTKKTAEYSNRAITDMSDNANKMGTDMTMIQNAYQGFAKQNYTMLDNLKLGYGGTKTEMQRLIQDASKLTDVQKELGITVDANDMSFGNIVNAISVVQKEMGIMGTTSKEASTTISGSLNSMKSAWSNLLTGIADENANFEQLINNFINTIVGENGKGGVLNNLLPRIQQTILGLGQLASQLLEKLVPEIIKTIPPLIQNSLPILIQAIETAITSLLNVLPQITDAISGLIPQIVQSLVSMLPLIIDVGIQILLSLIQGIAEAVPQLVAMLPEVINKIVEVLINNIGLIIETGVEILLGLVNGIIQALPQLIEMLPTIIDTIVTTLLDNIELIINAGIELLLGLIEGITDALPQLIDMIPTIIYKIVETLISKLPKIIETGAKIITSLIEGIAKMISSLVSKVGEVGEAIIKKIKEYPSKMIQIGIDLVQGLWNGIANAKDWIMSKIGGWCDSIVQGIKNFFGIHSPSTLFRDEIGENLALGLGEGFTKEMKNVTAEMEDAIPTNFDTNATINGLSTSSMGLASEYSYTKIVEAFQDALSSMKIELDDEEAGKFVRKTVEDAIYT